MYNRNKENISKLSVYFNFYGVNSKMVLENSFFILTNNKVDVVFSEIKTLLSPNDKLFIVEITTNYHGWLPAEAWEWLQNSYKKINNHNNNYLG